MNTFYLGSISIAMLLIAGLSPVCLSQESPYSREKIEELIQSGKAQRHGAQFANQGLGCQTFLWQPSDNKHVFFFTRNGTVYCEYREQKMSNQKYLQIDEMFLCKEARDNTFIKKAEKLPFIRTQKMFHRQGNDVKGYTVRWEKLIRDKNGKVLEHLNQGIEKFYRTVITFHVPDEMMSPEHSKVDWENEDSPIEMEDLHHGFPEQLDALFKAGDQEYMIAIYKSHPTKFEKAYLGTGKFKGDKGMFLGWEKVVNGKCEMRLDMSIQHPGVIVELLARVPSPPDDALPMARYRSISSMKCPHGIAPGETIVFKANDTPGVRK